MKGRFCRFVMIMMFITRVICRPLGPNHGPPTLLPPQQAATAAKIMSFHPSMASKTVTYSESSTRDEEEEMVKKNEEEEGYGRGIGSRPPSCEHKCYGCSPCEATQVPTTSHLGIQYTNYEPEGWKCKCGPTFYSP